MDGICLNCAHSHSVQGAANESIGETGPLYCRRYPPSMHMLVISPRIAGQAPGVSFAGTYAMVQPEASCGEFKSRYTN